MYFIKARENGREEQMPVTVTRVHADGAYDCAGALAGGQWLREQLYDESGSAVQPSAALARQVSGDAAAQYAKLEASGQMDAFKAAVNRLDRLVEALMTVPGMEKIIGEAMGNG